MKYKQYDKLILNHVGEYGFITTSQCYNLFYNTHTYGYIEANRKLKKLYDTKWLKRSKTKSINRYSYYCTNPPSQHNILIMDFYSELIKHGATIDIFEQEVEWESVIINKNPMRSDAYIEYSLNGNTSILLLEVDVTHEYNLDNYEKLYESGEIQTMLKNKYGVIDYFPRVVVVTKKINPIPHVGNIDVIYLDYDMSDFLAKILL